MRRFRAPMLVGVVLISGMAQHTEAQAVVFNEVLAVNDTVLADEAGEFDDWVELYNGDEEDVDLTGYFLTDNLTVPAQWQLDGIVVPAGGYVVLWLDDQPEQGNHHAPFRLDGAGERLGLFAPDGETAIDTLSFPIQAPDRSFGRQPDGGASWLYFLTPTPNAPNTTAGQTLTASAEPDWVAGLYSGAVTVSFESPSRDAVVHYTLDGTVPDASSPVLDAPLVIDRTTAVRTVAYAPDRLPSRVATHTYLIDEYNTLPKLSLVTDPANLYSSETGIFSDAVQDTSCTVRCENYWQDWERDVHAEYFEAGGERIFGFDMGIKVSGFFSRPDSKKSMGLRTRSRYGTSVIDVPLFDQETFTDRYDGLQVRASRFARSRNEVFFVLNERAGRHLDMQAFRPSHIFLNGAYHGIYNVMERKDEYYAFVHYGEDDVDLIDGVEGLKTGDFVHYNQTVEYLGSEAFRTEEGFRYAAEALVDMESMVEHYATNVIYGRPDYGNIRMWRPRTPDGRWRFLAFDFDLSYPEDDTMARMLNGSRPGELHNMLETLLESPPFKRAFLTRFSDLLNTVYEPETHIAVIDSVADAIEPEMGREIERWISRYETYMPNVRTWTYFIRERRDFAEKRPDRVRQHVRDALNLGAQVELVLEVDVSDADAGSISVNGLKVGASPWTGLYFPGLPVTLSAEPQPGYRFAGWSGEDVPDEPTVTVTMSRARSLTARFTKSVTPPRLVVTEINYHPWPVLDAGDWVELHSLSADTVALDGWRLVDQSGNEAELIGTVEPSGYVVLCREPEAFERVYAFSCTSTFDYSL
ncbi:MAG: CotH kinase family protein, partial [Bacteroidota bacterium]